MGGVKSGGDAAGEGGRQGPCGRGWVDGGLATVGKLLSVKCLEPLDGAPFPGPLSSSLTFFLFSNGDADSSCNLICSSLLESLESVSLIPVSKRDRGRPFLLVSISWNARTLFILLPLPPRRLLRGVWVQASRAVASQQPALVTSTLQASLVSSSTSTLMTASFTSCSSSGRTSLTSLVEMHVEHHSTREGQLEEVT